MKDQLQQKPIQRQASPNWGAGRQGVTKTPPATAAAGSTVQRARTKGVNSYDAGIGAAWHVHHGEHVKYNGNDDTRMNFDGRSKEEVLEHMAQYHAELPNKYRNNPVVVDSYLKCQKWVNKNL